MKIAVIHDWLNTDAGAEKVLKEIISLYPGCDLYCLFDFLNDELRNKVLLGKKTKTSYLQHIPKLKNFYQKSLILFPSAIERLDVSAYNIIISSSHAVAKGVRTNANQLHICYCHTPMRYVWDLRSQYMDKMSWNSKIFANYTLEKLKKWDVKSSKHVDYFIANSQFVAARIRKYYGKDSVVIYPPVRVQSFVPDASKREFFVTASRFVPYKKIDVIIKAFNLLPEQKLIIIGDGEEKKYLKSIAHKNIEFIHNASDEVLQYFLKKAQAFIYAAIEDFGILPVEAQASGTPVIAYGKGGLLETVIENQTGYFYHEQNELALKEKIEYFLTHNQFNTLGIRKHAEQFSNDIFRQKLANFVSEKYADFLISKV